MLINNNVIISLFLLRCETYLIYNLNINQNTLVYLHD